MHAAFGYSAFWWSFFLLRPEGAWEHSPGQSEAPPRVQEFPHGQAEGLQEIPDPSMHRFPQAVSLPELETRNPGATLRFAPGCVPLAFQASLDRRGPVQEMPV
jgi:hypothetical protein